MSSGHASERTNRRGVTFSTKTLETAQRITNETRQSLPALIELLLEKAGDYQTEHGAFPMPFRIVSEIDYQRYQDYLQLADSHPAPKTPHSGKRTTSRKSADARPS